MNWDYIFWALFVLPGVILSAPAILIERILNVRFIKYMEEDVVDRWAFAHVLAAYILVNVAVRRGMVLWQAAALSFVVMYAYELVIDGLRIEDKNGFSMLDIGENFWGVILGVLTWII